MEKKGGWDAGRLLGVSSGYWQGSTLHAAVQLDIFTLLGEELFSGGLIARQLDSDERGTGMLLNALVAMGLLEKESGYYRNSAAARRLLDKKSPDYIGYIIMHHHHLVDGWAQLDRAVTTGCPVQRRSYGEERERESFQMGMFNLAMAIAPRLAAEIDLAGRHHLLDLGGGPGTHAIHFCLANPDLRATVFDRPTTEEFAMRTARHFNVEGRINFMAGDFNVDPIAGTYDVILLSHILHSNGPGECRRLIAKSAAALEPGGLMLVHDFFLNETMDGPLFPALFSLNMLINNEQGRSYGRHEVEEMMVEAGLGDIHRLSFQAPNDSYVLCGTV